MARICNGDGNAFRVILLSTRSRAPTHQRLSAPGTSRLTLHSSRPRAGRWLGASAPRASEIRVSVWPAREGTWRLSERTLAARNSRSQRWHMQENRSEGEWPRSEEHTSELQSRFDLVCRLLLEKKKSRRRGPDHADAH